MSNPWFRHYCGMMRDEKLVSVAVKSKQSVERVVWVWGAILESSSEVNDGGRYEFDADGAAYFLRADSADIHAILDALTACGRLVDGVVVKWSDRQFQSDKSTARQAAYRERKRASGSDNNNQQKESDVTVTSRDGEVTAQDTDTDTDTELKKVRGAVRPDKRGCRLPDDFNPDETCQRLFSELNLELSDWPKALANFKDYWMGVPGARGLKLDWHGTFRNSLRKFAEFKPRSNQNAPNSHKPNSIAGSSEIVEAAIARRIREIDALIASSEEVDRDVGSIPRLRESAA